jgi:hypothetical protein
MNPSEGLPGPSERYELKLDDQGGPIPWLSNAGRPLDDPFALSQAAVRPPPNTSNYDLGRQSADVTSAPAAAAPPTRPVGWYRNASDPNDVRYWDGTRWLDRQPEDLNGTSGAPDEPGSTAPTPPPAIETGDWHPDPLGRYRLRWLTAGVATRFVCDEDGRVSFDEPNPNPNPTAEPMIEPTPGPEPESALDLNGADTGAHTAVVSPAPAEWYPDPADPARLRYWDGSGWTGHVLDQTPSA